MDPLRDSTDYGALPPCLHTTAPQPDAMGRVLLSTQDVTLHRASEAIARGSATFALTVWPESEMRYEVLLSSSPPLQLSEYSDTTLRLMDGSVLEHLPTWLSIGSSGAPLLAGILQGRHDLSRVPAMRVATSHLSGFTEYIGLRTRNQQLQHPNAASTRLDLSYDHWSILIDALLDFSSTQPSYSPGRFSHILQMQRLDGCLINAHELSDLSSELHLFLSYASGRWVAPLAITGHTADGDAVIPDWSVRRNSPLVNAASWFDKRMTADELAAAWHAWRAARTNSNIRAALDASLPLYYSANSGRLALESSIVLTQTALETLAAIIVVDCYGLESTDRFDRRSADSRVRKLLKWASLSEFIPPELTNLYRLRTRKEFANGPLAISTIRHWFLHPNEANRKNLRGIDRACAHEARTLAKWYVDLVVLRLIGWIGRYANRTSQRYVGQSERVPWAR